MPKDKAFHDYVVHDLLAVIEGISSRAMFGGWGIYRYGVMFALIADGELYFKVNDANRAFFEEAGSHPFRYNAKEGKQVSMGYWTLPEHVMEDHEVLELWVARSIAAHTKKS